MKFYILSLLLFVPVTSFAANENEVYYGDAGEPALRLRPYASVGLDLAYGKQQSADATTYASRSFGSYGLDAAFGAHYLLFDFALAADYRLWRQTTHSDSTNLNGNEFSWGPMLAIDYGHFALLGKYFVGSTYNLTEPSALGGDQKFSKPSSSFAIQLRYRFFHEYIGFEYRTLRFEKFIADGVETSLSPSTQLKASSYGLSLGVFL